jgi:hypothetical protein
VERHVCVRKRLWEDGLRDERDHEEEALGEEEPCRLLHFAPHVGLEIEPHGAAVLALQRLGSREEERDLRLVNIQHVTPG